MPHQNYAVGSLVGLGDERAETRRIVLLTLSLGKEEGNDLTEGHQRQKKLNLLSAKPIQLNTTRCGGKKCTSKTTST